MSAFVAPSQVREVFRQTGKVPEASISAADVRCRPLLPTAATSTAPPLATSTAAQDPSLSQFDCKSPPSATPTVTPPPTANSTATASTRAREPLTRVVEIAAYPAQPTHAPLGLRPGEETYVFGAQLDRQTPLPNSAESVAIKQVWNRQFLASPNSLIADQFRQWNDSSWKIGRQSGDSGRVRIMGLWYSYTNGRSLLICNISLVG